MSDIASSDLSNLMIARRLMDIEHNADLRRRGKHVDEKSALDYFGEDQALISGSTPSDIDPAVNPLPPIENIDVRLADIQGKLKDLQNANTPKGGNPAEGFTITASQSVEIKMELRYRSNTPVQGLVVHDKNYAESDRYLFKFADGSTFTILDKWTNKSTTIWGDPHVDVDDVEGNGDGDFKDLKTSDDFTTFMLMDGTRVTFKAKDDGLIEQVDIFKGSQQVTGIGSDSKDFSPETGLFNTKVLDNGAFAANKTPIGDMVFAGGDGNDWFDAGNKMVWGKTTGPVITQRPLATLEFYYRQTVSQSITVQTIAKEA